MIFQSSFFFLHLVILTEYLVSTVTVVSCNTPVALHQELEFFFFCCQYAFINYFSYQKQHHFYPIIQSTRKIVNVHQIQYQNHYVIFTRITIPS